MSPSLLILSVAAALAATSMLIFALSGRRLDAEATRKGTQFALGSFFVHWFMWLLGPVERLVRLIVVGTVPIVGHTINVLVGGVGANQANGHGGGGGGSYVYENATDPAPLMVAGGGGGSSSHPTTPCAGGPGSATVTPTNPTAGGSGRK